MDKKLLVKALKEVNPNIEWWNNHYRDNKDGTIRVSFKVQDLRPFGHGEPVDQECNSAKEAKAVMLDAISRCSKKLQDSVVKVTCGSDGERGRYFFIVSVVIRPSTNDYYGVHDIE